MEMCELRNHPNPTIRKEWDQSVANEYRWLIQGFRMKQEGKIQVKGFDIFHFIHKHQIPKNNKVTYARFCCDVLP